MNFTKSINFFASILIFSFLATSCTKNSSTTATDGNWVKRSEFDGLVRTGAVAFTIGDSAYIGTGYDGSERLNDFWHFSAEQDAWSQRADFPGVPRNSAVGLSIGQYGYIGTGYDGANMLNDFWQYDPSSNSWTQKANFAGTPRYGAVGFGIGNFGYITTGFDGTYLKDMYAYDPSTDSWSIQVSYGGNKRSGAVAFVYNNKAYLVTGFDNGTPQTDFWVFDPSNVSTPWSELNQIANVSTESFDDSYADIQRQYAVVLVMGDYAYLTTGINASGALVSTTWQYDFATDIWTTKTSYERPARQSAVSFSVEGRGFVGTGQSSSLYLDDFDEFLPNEAYNAND